MYNRFFYFLSDIKGHSFFVTYNIFNMYEFGSPTGILFAFLPKSDIGHTNFKSISLPQELY